jgi:DNA-binding GntR family transcriptional regulator
MRRVLRQFQQIGKTGESIEAVKIIREFARHLIARCDNPVLADMVDQLAPEVARSFGRHLRAEDIPVIARAAQAFLKSVETRDADAASEAFAKVITSSSATVMAALYNQSSSSVREAVPPAPTTSKPDGAGVPR